MGRPVFQVIPGAALQTFPVRSQNGLFQHISGRIIGILHPSVDTVLSVKDSLPGQAVVRIVASVDLGALRGGDLCQVAVGIVGISCNGGLYRAVALDFLRPLNKPPVFIVGIMNDTMNTVRNGTLFQRYISQTVIIVAHFCHKVIFHYIQMIVFIVGKMDPVPAIRLSVPFYFLLSVGLLHLIALTVIGIGDDTVQRRIGLLHFYLFPDLPAQIIIGIEDLLSFAVHFPEDLSVPVVLVGVQDVPPGILYFCHPAAGVIGIAVAIAVIRICIIRFRLYLFDHVAVRIIESPLHASVRIKDTDAVPVRIVLIAGSFSLFAFQGIADRMDPAGDVPVKVAEYTVMFLQGRYGIYHTFQKIVAVLIAALFLFPLHGRIVGGQIAHAVIESTGGIAFPVDAAGDKVPGIVSQLHRAVSIADGQSAAYGIVAVGSLLPLRRNDTAGVCPVGFIFLKAFVSEGIPLQNASSPEIILPGRFFPFALFDLFHRPDRIVFLVISIEGLSSVAVPCMYQIMVLIIFMVHFKAIREFFPDASSIGIILPLFPAAQAADFSHL